jgi:hypothetical protein
VALQTIFLRFLSSVVPNQVDASGSFASITYMQLRKCTITPEENPPLICRKDLLVQPAASAAAVMHIPGPDLNRKVRISFVLCLALFSSPLPKMSRKENGSMLLGVRCRRCCRRTNQQHCRFAAELDLTLPLTDLSSLD